MHMPSLIAAALVIGSALPAGARDPAPANESDTDDLTFHGITLYGTIDIGVAYQNHGVKLSQDFPPGLEYVVSKNSNKSLFTLAPNALSSSKVGLEGHEQLTDDLSLIFQLETQFVPTSLRLADGPKTLVKNAGRVLSDQTASGDSNKAGQVFGGQVWGGVATANFGTLTFGRQSSLFLDDVLAYDPASASHAFSVVGYQGAAQAGASTEDARLDYSFKYVVKLQSFRFGGLYQFGADDRPASRVYQFAAGYDLEGGAIDLAYSHVNDSIEAASLNAEELLTAPRNSIAGTVSDNDAFGAFARYALAADVEIFLAYEFIEFRNPGHPLFVGDRTIGGYVLGAVDNSAFPRPRHLDYFWAGVRYAITPRAELTLTYYRSTQNSYGAAHCANDSLPTCSGALQALSAFGVFNLDKRWDIYAGAMYSQVSDGLASGFLNRSSVDPMAGVRFTF
jgi:predicted porin